MENLDEPNQNNIEDNLEKLPRSRFEIIDIDREAELFYSFMKRGRWSHVFDKVYPELRIIQKECKDKDECIEKYKEFLQNPPRNKKKKKTPRKEENEFEWNKVRLGFLEALSEHFETEWPKDKPEI